MERLVAVLNFGMAKSIFLRRLEKKAAHRPNAPVTKPEVIKYPDTINHNFSLGIFCSHPALKSLADALASSVFVALAGIKIYQIEKLH